MKSGWSAASSPDAFTLPHEVFELGLKQGPLLVYLYLICRKSLKHGADKINCAVIGKAVGLCEKTVRTHLHTVISKGYAGTGQRAAQTGPPREPSRKRIAWGEEERRNERALPLAAGRGI